jgi:hypothetical protein
VDGTDPTWQGLIAFAAWTFLASTLAVAASAIPAVAKAAPRLVPIGFLGGIVSFVLVLLAWGLPRLFGGG